MAKRGPIPAKWGSPYSSVRETKYEPLHPGAVFREVREDQAPPVSQRQSAFRLGVSVKHLYDIERGAKPVSVAMAVKIEELTGVSAEMWLTLQVRHDLWHALRDARKAKRLIPGPKFDTARRKLSTG